MHVSRANQMICPNSDLDPWKKFDLLEWQLLEWLKTMPKCSSLQFWVENIEENTQIISLCAFVYGDGNDNSIILELLSAISLDLDDQIRPVDEKDARCVFVCRHSWWEASQPTHVNCFLVPQIVSQLDWRRYTCNTTRSRSDTLALWWSLLWIRCSQARPWILLLLAHQLDQRMRDKHSMRQRLPRQAHGPGGGVCRRVQSVLRQSV